MFNISDKFACPCTVCLAYIPSDFAHHDPSDFLFGCHKLQECLLADSGRPGVQAAVATPSILVKNERFSDFSGSITYLFCTALSLFLPAIRARSAAALTGASKPAWPSLLSALNGQGGPLGFNWRQVALSAVVSIWAVRCKSHKQVPNIVDALTHV